ncbi:MAG: chemotaxis protein CheW [Pseudoxanthomonas sp.]
MARSNDEIRGVLVQVGPERVLLPNATVAEVLARVPVQAVADAPHWLPGTIDWQGWQVPLFSMVNLGGLGQEVVSAASKIVVLKTLTGGEAMPYMGLLTQSFPRLISVPRDGLLADASEESLPEGVQMRVLLGDEAALLPDLEAIERMVADVVVSQPA